MGMLGSMGAGKAAAAQAQAMGQIAKGYGKVGKQQYDWISPWMNAGTQALSGQMQMLANPLNTQGALSDYYADPQYNMEMDQAQYETQAAAEAAGGLGNTATGNALAAQSVDMGNQYLQGLSKQRQQQFSNLGGISQQGLGATKQMANWAFQDYNAAAQMLGQAAGVQGQATAAPYMGAQSNVNRSIGLGMKGFGMAMAGGLI